MRAGRLLMAFGVVLAGSGALFAQTPTPLVLSHDVGVAPPAQTNSPPRIDLRDPTVPGAPPVVFGPVDLSGSFQTATGRVDGGFGATWQATASVRYRAPGGLDIAAGVVGRRGYQLPLFMTTGAGTDSAIPTAAESFVATSRVPILWDTRLRIQKRIVARRGLDIDIVGEALNLLKVNPALTSNGGDLSGTLTSRTFRLGLLFGF